MEKLHIVILVEVIVLLCLIYLLVKYQMREMKMKKTDVSKPVKHPKIDNKHKKMITKINTKVYTIKNANPIQYPRNITVPKKT